MLTVAQIEEAKARFITGESSRDLGRRFSVSHTTILKSMRSQGINKGYELLPMEMALPKDSATLAYIAAMIDGEGCISKNTGKELWTVCIYNTSLDLMHWLVQFGGRIELRKFGPITEIRRLEAGIVSVKDQWTWKVSHLLDVYNLLTTVSPYMIIKRQKAQDVIGLIEGKPNFQKHQEHIINLP